MFYQRASKPFSDYRLFPRVRLRAAIGQWLHFTVARLQHTDENEMQMHQGRTFISEQCLHKIPLKKSHAMQ